MKLDNNQEALLMLLRAGLWSGLGPVSSSMIHVSGDVGWGEVYRLAEEQSVTGLIADGIDRFKILVPGFSIPQEWALQFIGNVLQLEQQNKAMNEFVAQLIDMLRRNSVYALLVKGQGVAQCYEKPLWRACGDVDLLLSTDNYQKAFVLLSEKASSIEDEKQYNKHIEMSIGGWSVELHGTLRSGLWNRLDRVLDNVQHSVFCEGKVRSWMNGRTQAFLPAADEDVFFVFSHILQHFYKEGIGLRQICDWCRLLWTYREKLDLRLLEERIRKAGVMSEWRAFASLAVKYLGMPEAAMPMLGSKVQEFKVKADKVMEFVMETGNFGHNRDYSYRQKHSYIVFKVISMWKHIQDFGRYFVIFPLDSIKVTWRRMCVGMAVTVSGRMHE